MNINIKWLSVACPQCKAEIAQYCKGFGCDTVHAARIINYDSKITEYNIRQLPDIKEIKLDYTEMAPKSTCCWIWRPETYSELLDVTLENVEGTIDYYVIIGNRIQAAFSKRRKLILPNETITIYATEYGCKAAGCSPVIVYRNLDEIG